MHKPSDGAGESGQSQPGTVRDESVDLAALTVIPGNHLESVTIKRNERSRPSGTNGHVETERVVTMARNKQCTTIRVKLLKIGARVRITARKMLAILLGILSVFAQYCADY